MVFGRQIMSDYKGDHKGPLKLPLSPGYLSISSSESFLIYRHKRSSLVFTIYWTFFISDLYSFNKWVGQFRIQAFWVQVELVLALKKIGK
jgi:hypothetical protein